MMLLISLFTQESRKFTSASLDVTENTHLQGYCIWLHGLCTAPKCPSEGVQRSCNPSHTLLSKPSALVRGYVYLEERHLSLFFAQRCQGLAKPSLCLRGCDHPEEVPRSNRSNLHKDVLEAVHSHVHLCIKYFKTHIPVISKSLFSL